MAPHLLPDADVVLVGVSRTGKTPLSVVLSQTMGLKVANIPLVVDLSPPQQLFQVDPKRVFCLTLNPDDLQRIRKTRMERELGNKPRGGFIQRKQAGSSSNYADYDYLLRDLEHARVIAKENRYTNIDVTGRAVEETASLISSLLNDRFPNLEASFSRDTSSVP
jgi:regulator of PEP synthase PpsR (kinase-PPPase family)